jgi:hypothetical protein
VVIGLGFLLLLLAFRSLLIPFTAAVMNLLARSASFGVIVCGLPVGRPAARDLGRGRALSRPSCR